ncbi:MAG: haloalkane dehalogenase [Gammaproteobacteria bacterium]|jgi:haloalkane dehalogenase|nr:haloalkane dehalogenase [Gammaproteobacteria bacterium]
MTLPEQQFVEVQGLRMAYVEAGQGDPIVFLHGNPVSSALWRNIIPGVRHQGRCVAPDLVGMGASEPLPGSGPGRYSFALHSAYLDAFFAALGIDSNVMLVVHDWGSALGFDWARRNPERVAGIAYMEAIVMPLSWQQWPAASRPLFEALRSPAGDALIRDRNIFVERILPGSIQRTLDPAEMAHYRAPFADDPDSRWPTLDWPRQLPIEGEPAEVCARVQAYADWLAVAAVPKLFINAEPGAILVGEQREFCRSWPNQTEVTVAGIHFIQEDSPAEITAALSTWLTAGTAGSGRH